MLFICGMQKLLGEFFKSISDESKEIFCTHLETKRMLMESYAGEGVAKWQCSVVRGDQVELDRLRLHYIKEICTTDINLHHKSNVGRALCFLLSHLTASKDLFWLLLILSSLFLGTLYV